LYGLEIICEKWKLWDTMKRSETPLWPSELEPRLIDIVELLPLAPVLSMFPTMFR